MRINHIKTMEAGDYKEYRERGYTLEIETSNLKYRKEILVRTTLEHSIDFERGIFYKNAKALQHDPKDILTFLPEIIVQTFPTIGNLKAQVKYWNKANERLNSRY